MQKYTDLTKGRLLIIGRRINYPMKANQTIRDLKDVKYLASMGELFRSDAIDFFITTKNGYPWQQVPNFVIGRPGYDNWMIANALDLNAIVIDVTFTTAAVHQTGKDGNFAGHLYSRKEKFVNHRILGTDNFARGHTLCAPWETSFGDLGNIVVQQRKTLPAFCYNVLKNAMSVKATISSLFKVNERRHSKLKILLNILKTHFKHRS